jgi:Peptidogalycan biosysnthesis/recognition
MLVERLSSIKRVDESEWRALEPPDFSFFDYEFLLALQRSRSVGRRTEWSPVHLILARAAQPRDHRTTERREGGGCDPDRLRCCLRHLPGHLRALRDEHEH